MLNYLQVQGAAGRNETLTTEEEEMLKLSPTQQAKKMFPPQSGGYPRWQTDLVQKCYNKLAVLPRKGSAILFYSQLPNGVLDDQSLHGGCPVLQGAIAFA